MVWRETALVPLLLRCGTIWRAMTALPPPPPPPLLPSSDRMSLTVCSVSSPAFLSHGSLQSSHHLNLVSTKRIALQVVVVQHFDLKSQNAIIKLQVIKGYNLLKYSQLYSIFIKECNFHFQHFFLEMNTH